MIVKAAEYPLPTLAVVGLCLSQSLPQRIDAESVSCRSRPLPKSILGHRYRIEFAGQHEIPAQVIDETNLWLKTQIN